MQRNSTLEDWPRVKSLSEYIEGLLPSLRCVNLLLLSLNFIRTFTTSNAILFLFWFLLLLIFKGMDQMLEAISLGPS